MFGKKLAPATFFYIIFLILMTTDVGYSQPVKHKIITGTVYNAQTNQPVSGVELYFAHSDIKTESNRNGHFKLEVKLVGGKGAGYLIIYHPAFKKEVIKLRPRGTYKDLEIFLIPVAQMKVVVTATRNEKQVMDIPAASYVMERDEVTEEIASNLTDLLDKTPGFTQIWEYHSPLVMRGLNSKRLVVLKNGNRCIGSFPGGFMGQALNVYNVERIEIIRGPASVMYGTGAIAGVINIISPDPFKIRGFRTRLEGGFGSNNLERIGLAGFSWASSKLACMVTGKWRKADEYKFGDRTTARFSWFEDKDIAAHAGWKLNDNHTFLLDFDMHFGGPWGKPEGFNNKENLKVFNEEESWHIAPSYTIEDIGLLNKLSISLYYDSNHRDYHKCKLTETDMISSEEIVEYEYPYGGGSIYASLAPLENLLVSVGLDGYAFRISSPSTEYDYIKDITTEKPGVKNAGITSGGIFSQVEWDTIPEELSFIAGLRYDIAAVTEGDNPAEEGEKTREEQRDAVSGNVGVIWHPIEMTSLTFNAGRAFRMPNAAEMFTKTVSCIGIKEGNPDIEPEYSWNFDLGFRGNIKSLDFDVSLFMIFLDDLIALELIEDEDTDTDYYTYTNVSKARILGGEASVSYLFHIGKGHHVVPRFSAVYTYGADVSGKNFLDSGGPIHGIPPLRLRGSLRYVANFGQLARFFLETEVDHSFEQDRVPEDCSNSWGSEPSDAYTLFGLASGLGFPNIPGKPSINLRIKNLLDEDYKPFGSYIPGMGINMKFLVQLNFLIK